MSVDFGRIKKYSKASNDIDEKLEYLKKEFKKVGLCEIAANSTSGVYVRSEDQPNPLHDAFKNSSYDGQKIAFSGASFNIDAPPLGNYKYSPPHPVTGERRVGKSWFGIANGFQKVSKDSDRELLWYFRSDLAPNGRWVSLELRNGNWCTWISTFFGAEMLVPYNSVDSDLPDDVKNKLNGTDINRFINPDEWESPTNRIFFQNELGNSAFTPININGLSGQGFAWLKKKAKNLALFGFGGKTPKPIYYGGQKGEDLRNLMKSIDKFNKQSPLGGGPGGTFKLSHVPEGDLLSEAVKLGHFEPEVLNVNIDDLRKGIAPEFPKDPPPEMIDGYAANSRLAPKKLDPVPYIKITKKDLAQNHKLTDKEITLFMNDIKMVNDYIKKNPADLIYAQQRYPKHDPRLAELNWQMDQMMDASKEYVDKQFPENQKLFNQIKKKIKNTIAQTDPKNFKGVKLPKFDKTHLEDFKRKKEVYSRFMKKPINIKKLFKKKEKGLTYK